MGNEQETDNTDLKKTENNKEEKKTSFSKEGGLYSRIPKNKKSIQAATIMVIIFGFIFVGLIVLGVIFQC